MALADQREPDGVLCPQWNLGQAGVAWVHDVVADLSEGAADGKHVLIDEVAGRWQGIGVKL